MTARTHWHCGHLATPENTQPGVRGGIRCLTCMRATRERDENIAIAYIAGKSRAQLAVQFQLSQGRIDTILGKLNVVLSKRERVRRANAAVKKKRGRKPAWPNCPRELRSDYMKLRQYYPAVEARAMLEATR